MPVATTSPPTRSSVAVERDRSALGACVHDSWPTSSSSGIPAAASSSGPDVRVAPARSTRPALTTAAGSASTSALGRDPVEVLVVDDGDVARLRAA